MKINENRTTFGIYVSLLPGDFDAIIRFPFDYQIIICLFDQTEERKHIIKSFKANFPRPSAETICSNGIEDFAPIFQENSPYVQDGAIYIKILIDFLGLPISVYAPTFNFNQTMSTSFIRQ